MKRQPNYLILLLLLLLPVLLLAACQRSDVVVTPPIAPAATHTPPPTATPLPPSPTTPPTSSAPASPTPRATAIPNTPTPTPTPTVTPTATPYPEAVSSVSLRRVASGFFKPLYLTHAFDERLFVVEQHGVISIIQDGQRLATPFLDIQDLVNSAENEQGLLSVAFHPNYANNGRFFINYTREDGATVIARYQVSSDPNLANPRSAEILLTIDQPYANHNGGLLKFGPDGYLYVGMGDGGSADDPEGNGQNPGTLLGTLLRIDVDNGNDEVAYAVPPDNPFATQPNWRAEIWAIGLRNPWRFSFDSLTGDLYIADVGQNTYEEVNFTPAGTPGGLNYGWNIMEANHCFLDPDCNPAGLVRPVTEYDHSEGCSVTGGYVYRGHQYPTLFGNYFFADYCQGDIWSLVPQPDGSWLRTRVIDTTTVISSFGEGADGEIYVVDHVGGVVYHLQP